MFEEIHRDRHQNIGTVFTWGYGWVFVDANFDPANGGANGTGCILGYTPEQAEALAHALIIAAREARKAQL